MNLVTETPNYFLDITNDLCPITFVKTKLLVEKMRSGEVAEIRIPSGEPLENLPRSVCEEGHAILSLEQVPGSGMHVLRMRKS